MKRFKLPKLSTKKFNLKGFLSYILLILLSSAILALILISLPLTERVSSSSTYDLVNKNSLYWAKEYVLELDTSKSIRKDDDIEGIKSIIYKRLSKYGVEKTSMYAYEEDSKDYLKVSVQTSKSRENIDYLVKSPFLVNIVTRKADVDYENADDPLAPYLDSNYDKTEFTRETFRNVYITQLKNSGNTYSYFALFKTWPWSGEWETFLKDNTGQTVGVSIDGFVTPVQIPADQSNLFPVPVSATEKDQAFIISLLYNSGVVPVNYSTNSETDIPIDMAEIDYIKLTEGILLAIVLIYAYLLIVDKTTKNILVISGLSTIITISAWISYLKITETPVDIFLLAVEVITMVAILRIIVENTESRIVVTTLIALIAAVSMILGTGYIKIFSSDLLLLIIVGNFALSLSKYYVAYVNKSLKI
ncbi:hypothetical protein A3K02_01630 [candidate division WS6 bacterium RIFOXYD1_FULL_33_8]|uniref:Uncharacterized protein n=2 Tax=Candidatus Dojkabacteria TaxID=74243 RepID=A0A0G0DGP2_9BACT|nr:MAG: hypothetical protein UR32_C0016G0014 [candidate division WS6 bacterium GW2011_GWE2_33_157]KKP44516.1 MAG: hypothetical protein UR34_C0002G0019 [candidate division WS6 bacterium GW2011_GWC1_33_20]KKP44635.1 MAG: hypothetical protein UR36_C0015G0010 [candidate division WS6 bacterium GW2011_GWF1_33_233]KKP54269.1 MAG: hypothetical protein UR45_C0020G0009 [candidate division WS6 bacterium GW2011_WS6_33_547]KKP54527.1 MAG: hypothetical protein UR47_C0015G0007 [candidate division WS6 bacteriu